MFTQKNIGILKPLEKDLKAAHLCWQCLLAGPGAPSIPEIIVERLGREIHDIGVRNKVGS
jgi:hypothetical protein